MIKEKKIGKIKTESELNFYFDNAMEDPHTRMEFIRKGRGEQPRQKVGVMIACQDPIDPYRVIIGFSLCHLDYDDFDKINFGILEAKNFGKKVAHRRAMKFRGMGKFTIYSEKIDKISGVVYIPQTVHESLANFMFGCYKYYKDKDFPAWVLDYFPREMVEGEEDEDENN
jgi:hypothetical protein